MIISLPLASSTQDILKAGTSLNWPNGTLLIANQQTGGRGRQGRVWLSPPGNFYGSYLHRGEINPAHLGWLSLAIGVSVIEALPAVNPQTQLKWPNDVLLNGKKLAGLLIEREGDALIIGLGVNLQHAPPITDGRYESIALKHIYGLASVSEPSEFGEAKKISNLAPLPAAENDNQIPTPLQFAQAWQAVLQRWLTIWQQQDFAAIKTAWLHHHAPLGTALQVRRDAAVLTGTFAGLAGDGALQLQTATELLILHNADVFFPPRP